MKIKALCGHEIEIPESELSFDGIIDFYEGNYCEKCGKLHEEKNTKQSLRDTMSGIANHYEAKGKKWNPITKEWR